MEYAIGICIVVAYEAVKRYWWVAAGLGLIFGAEYLMARMRGIMRPWHGIGTAHAHEIYRIVAQGK